jgi:Na+-driven multidrug efflux pump
MELVLTSTDVWRWLAIGVVINGFAHIPFTLLQSAGRTDTIAKIHLSELPWYILALWWALLHDGIRGAAIVWTLRVAVDTVLLIACAIRYFPHIRRTLLSIGVWALVAGLLTLGIAAAGPRAPSLSLLLTATALASLWGGYHLRPFMTIR